MQMPGRNGSTDSYRYGFQGQETDNEITGSESHVSYKYRMHDARLGRFLSLDPLAPKYPHNSPYAFSENRVIDGVELEGLEFAGSGKLENEAIGEISASGPSKNLYVMLRQDKPNRNGINEYDKYKHLNGSKSGSFDIIVATSIADANKMAGENTSNGYANLVIDAHFGNYRDGTYNYNKWFVGADITGDEVSNYANPKSRFRNTASQNAEVQGLVTLMEGVNAGGTCVNLGCEAAADENFLEGMKTLFRTLDNQSEITYYMNGDVTKVKNLESDGTFDIGGAYSPALTLGVVIGWVRIDNSGVVFLINEDGLTGNLLLDSRAGAKTVKEEEGTTSQ
jgi:RHS repeat-associated protein